MTREGSGLIRIMIQWGCWSLVVITTSCLLVAIGAFCIQPENHGYAHYLYLIAPILISLIAAAFAIVSCRVAIGVNTSVIGVRESVYGQSFDKAYADKSMLDALRVLGKLGNKGGFGLSQLNAIGIYPRTPSNNPKGRIATPKMDNHGEDKVLNLPWTEEEDSARRTVKNYFLDIVHRKRGGSIGEVEFKAACNKDALLLLFNVVEPMEYMLNPTYNGEPFYEIMHIMKDEYLRLVKRISYSGKKLLFADKVYRTHIEVLNDVFDLDIKFHMQGVQKLSDDVAVWFPKICNKVSANSRQWQNEINDDGTEIKEYWPDEDGRSRVANDKIGKRYVFAKFESDDAHKDGYRFIGIFRPVEIANNYRLFRLENPKFEIYKKTTI